MQTLTPVQRLHGNASLPFYYLEFLVHKFILLLLLFLSVIMAAGQGVDLKYRLEFKATKTTYYGIADTAYEFTGPELVLLQKHIVVDSTIREVDLNNDITTTIYHQQDTQFEDWMTRPAKTIITKQGTVLYDSGNKVLMKSQHSDTYISNYKKLKSMMNASSGDLIPEYTTVTEELISTMMENGFTYSDMGPKGSLFTRDTIEVYINNAELSDEVIIYSGNGTVFTSVKRGFRKNILEQVVPDFTIERTWDNRFPGNCVRKVVVTDFEDYKIIYPDGYRGDGDRTLTDKVIIHPNPVSDNLNITIPVDYFTSVTIEITDATGMILFSRQFASVQQELIVTVATLSNGMYVMRLYDDKKEINKTFYKN